MFLQACLEMCAVVAVYALVAITFTMNCFHVPCEIALKGEFRVAFVALETWPFVAGRLRMLGKNVTLQVSHIVCFIITKVAFHIVASLMNHLHMAV